jgi:ActR/RegA family two-component response regulator
MPAQDPRRGLAEALYAGELTAEELLRRYTTLVYAQTGNYQETARRLELDRRTIKSKIDPDLLEALRTGEPRK